MARNKYIGYEAARHRGRGRSPAQVYCLLAGLALLVAGVAGFFVDSWFDTGGSIDGDALIGFEINGFHDLVHLLSGLVLLYAARRRGAAKVIALLFGITYGAVAIIGLADGDTVLGLIPVNAADNILHSALAAVGVLAAVASDTDDEAVPVADPTARRTTGRRIESTLPVRTRG